MRPLVTSLVLAFAVHPLSAQGTQGAVDAARTDAARRAELVSRSETAIAELQTTLLARLKGALGSGGPQAAVTVCRDEAQKLTASIGAKHALQIGRTSDRVRNPANAPRPWAAAHVASAAGLKVADARPAVVDLPGGGVGILRPIGTAEFCVMCHGSRDAVQSVIGPVLAASYPKDQAVGFAPGDLRGWFWAEAR